MGPGLMCPVQMLVGIIPYDSKKNTVLLVSSIGFFHVLSMPHILF